MPIIRVFANVEGLSRNLKYGGLIPSGNVFRDFTIGFTDPVREHVDFIDVGEGKELADEKIKSFNFPLPHHLEVKLDSNTGLCR
jgi:hypothetical protein